ncbi:MAG: Asp-tRNA(Asn)/Glu-tRNA(Gln) amidotransferase subunit GatA [Planctomycetota bacterium]|nr:Asp-tRNA(Asn)/Glu-tRNA(Gln) amidotransferase subunit GatA [Planctomycetota bacterium]
MAEDLLSAIQISEKVRQGLIRAEDVTVAAIQRIDALDPDLHAFLHIDREDSLSTAREIDKRVAHGEDPGPLSGVPIAIKDNICVAGMPATAGSRILEEYVPPYDATVVERIRAAGGIVIGKTNLDEFAMGSSCEYSAYGPVRNPWDRERVPGGSSGGSAAAVASGMVPIALGSDTGGSIRQPASLCGIVGLKPTYGRVSRYGLIAFASSLDQIGSMARNVDDAALLLGVIAGRDAKDSTSSGEPTPRFLSGSGNHGKGIKVGLPVEYLEGVDPQIESKVREAVTVLERSGVEVREIRLPRTPYALPCYYLICTAEASSNLARYDGVHYGIRAEASGGMIGMYSATREQGFGAEVKLRILLGTFVLSAGFYDAYYKNATRVRTQIRDEFDRAFQEVDAIIGPTSPITAFKIGEKMGDPIQMYQCDVLTVAANLAGLPAISVPCGLADGLPAGFQVVGKPFAERDVLRLGMIVEEGISFPPGPQGMGVPG